MIKILIVDDREELLTLLRMLFDDAGYEVHVAHDGEEALHFLRGIDYYMIVLLDIRMMPMDGIEFLHAASADPILWARIRCAMLSAWVGGAAEVESIAAATATHIPFWTKPIDGEDLLTNVEALAVDLPQTD